MEVEEEEEEEEVGGGPEGRSLEVRMLKNSVALKAARRWVIIFEREGERKRFWIISRDCWRMAVSSGVVEMVRWFWLRECEWEGCGR